MLVFVLHIEVRLGYLTRDAYRSNRAQNLLVLGRSAR